MRTAIS